jgi:hypothetical protein
VSSMDIYAIGPNCNTVETVTAGLVQPYRRLQAGGLGQMAAARQALTDARQAITDLDGAAEPASVLRAGVRALEVASRVVELAGDDPAAARVGTTLTGAIGAVALAAGLVERANLDGWLPGGLCDLLPDRQVKAGPAGGRTRSVSAAMVRLVIVTLANPVSGSANGVLTVALHPLLRFARGADDD